jgi:hypothetical protein
MDGFRVRIFEDLVDLHEGFDRTGRRFNDRY